VARSKLPKTLGIVGVAIGFGFMAISWYVYKYNPFHLPPASAASQPGNYSAPPLDNLLDDLELTLVPGIWLTLLTMDLGNVVGEIMWVLAALINFPIYYGLGWAIVAIWDRIRPLQRKT
jgi:ABC-type uncharacterized transport system permease subunit